MYSTMTSCRSTDPRSLGYPLPVVLLLAGLVLMHPEVSHAQKRIRGTITNAEGRYTLRIDRLPARFFEFSAAVNDEEVVDSRDAGEGGGLSLSYGFGGEAWFNRVDAVHLAAEVHVDIGPRLTLRGEGGYKSGLAIATYGAGASYDLGPAVLEASYHYGVDPRWHSRPYGRSLNSVQTLLAKPDYFDYYGNERLRIALRRRFPALPADVQIRFNNERHFSVDKTTDYDLLGSNFVQPPNPPVPEGVLRSVSGTVTFGGGGLPLGLSAKRQLRLAFEYSDPSLLASDYDFTRLALAADYSLDTFFRRRLLPMTLDLRLVAGTSFGTLPPQRFGIVEASLRPYTPFGVLRTLANRPYEGAHHLGFFWEHNFRTIPFELVGLYALARCGYGLILHGGHGRTWIDEDRALFYIPNTPEGFHHELGLSVNGVLGILRIDFTKRLDAPGFTVGLAAGRLF